MASTLGREKNMFGIRRLAKQHNSIVLQLGLGQKEGGRAGKKRPERSKRQKT